MFKTIEEFPNYKINEFGDVMNSKGKILKKQVNVDGYFVVNLYKDVKGKSFHRRCARMLALTHMKDTYQEGFLINHKDLNKQNDTLSNLEWVSSLDNLLHSIENQPAVHNSGSVYTEDFIREICSLIQDGVRNKEILESMDITKDALLHIRCGNAWGWVSKDYKMTPSRKGISESTAKWCCYKLKEGLSYKEIIEQSTSKNLTISILKSIKSKKSWTRISKHIL